MVLYGVIMPTKRERGGRSERASERGARVGRITRRGRWLLYGHVAHVHTHLLQCTNRIPTTRMGTLLGSTVKPAGSARQRVPTVLRGATPATYSIYLKHLEAVCSGANLQQLNH